MTTVNYTTKTDLPSFFNHANFDPASQQAVINQLILDGLYDNSSPDDGKSVWVEADIHHGTQKPPLFDSTGNPNVPGFVQVLEVEGANVQVQTDSALKIIVDDGSNAHNTLNVTGGNHPVFVALGNSDTTVNLQDKGNDTVLAGSGADSIVANSGKDVLIGGAGADTLVGGSGADSLYAGSGNHSELIAGSGAHQELFGGTGSNLLIDSMSHGTDTLVAGSGKDVITGMQGDKFLLPSGTMVASGNDTYNIYDGGGNSTINLGTGADTVNFFSTHGNDTVTNGGAKTDVINFQNSATDSLTDIKSIKAGAQSGDYIIKFTDGQSVTLDGHGVSSTKDAFTIEFQEGTIHLKGGS